MRVIILVRQNLNKTFYKNWELEYKKKNRFSVLVFIAFSK